ncbi:MAG: ABC transporter permease, partial [Halioglobus sp.]|nr:ABC transporter permease [Halioglobus sp.]
MEQTMPTFSSGRLADALILPGLGILLFLMAWQISASRIETSLGQFPGPVQVWEQMRNLGQEHAAEREKAAAFYQRQQERNAQKLAANPEATVKWREYTGKPTFLDQVFTSLATVAVGFLMANLVAIPVGILCGLSRRVYKA